MAPKKLQKQSQQAKISSFFKVTPSNNETTKKNDELTKPRETEKRPITDENYDDIWNSPENSPKTTPKSAKRKRIIISSDEEDNAVDEKETLTSKSNNNRTPLTPRFQPSSSLIGSNPTTPKSVQRFTSQISSPFINSSSNAPTPSKTPKKSVLKKNDAEDEAEMQHLTFEFLKPNKIKDADGHLTSHPDYDSRTLFVPPDFMKKQTPGHQQWWQLKSQFFDTVLFFKVGKFYEMYHMDAVTGVENLGLAHMRGNFAHCGFPEMAFGNFAERLIRKGYKVARVEQTETPAQLEERKLQTGAKDKVVRRELCRITSQATQTYSAFDSVAENDEINTGKPESNYLLSICEKKNAEDGPTKMRFGVTFIDCSIGQFYLCEFVDDASYSTLRTLLAHNQPTQILLPRNGISKVTQSVINSILGPISTEELHKTREFLPASETLKMLIDEDYLGSNLREWPEALSSLIADLDEPIPKPNSECGELSLNALGAILWYLKKCLIDVDMVTMRKFETYTPTTVGQNLQLLPSIDRWNGRRMVLDGYALSSLHLLPPNDLLSRSHANAASKEDEGKTFSLLNTVDYCVTHFGRRLLRQWICAPMCDPHLLKQRQESIKFLCAPETRPLLEYATDLFKRVPDLERLFQRIHTLGLKYRSEKHPDSRAHIFDAARYNSRKVRDLCTTLFGLEQLQKLIEHFCEHNQESSECPSLIVECIGSKFEDMVNDLEHFNQLIPDREKVAKEGIIKPKTGMDSEYDQSLIAVSDAEAQLEQYLISQQKELKSKDISYFGTGKNRYQLEIPEFLTSKLNDNYELKSKRKGYKRYSTPELIELIENLSEMEKKRDNLINDSTRRVFEDFDKRKDKWSRIVNQMAIFDCLMSLARYSSQSPVKMCVPEFDFQSQEPYLEIRKGYHPLLSSSGYIPNDTVFGGELPPVLLLTGANMSGKSSLMRQTAVLVVLAQIGSLVPAESMRLTPVDRVFSRIGASDCLAAGQSTFYVELQETNIILKESSLHSLVIIDELGRGTSTFDGTAIASAVLKNLSEKVKCRTLFSTHYHSLCSKFAENSNVALGHMSCMVENEDVNGDPSMDNLTFLYTLVPGTSPKSFGFFTARLAGVNEQIVRRAYQCSKLLDTSNNTDYLTKLRYLALKVNEMSDDELIDSVKST